MFGAWPRLTSAAVYGYLAWSFLVEFAGGMVRTSHWLLHTSVFFHMVPAPVASPDWSSVAVITSLGILGAVLGGILLCRRYSRTLDPAQHRSGRITARSDSLKFFSERTVLLLRGIVLLTGTRGGSTGRAHSRPAGGRLFIARCRAQKILRNR